MPILFLSRNILLNSPGLEERQSFWIPSETPCLSLP